MESRTYVARQDGAAAANVVEEFMDINYPDERIEKVWPNMKLE